MFTFPDGKFSIDSTTIPCSIKLAERALGKYSKGGVKSTMKYDVVDTNYNINDLVGIVGDQTIHLSGYISEKKYPEDFRLVRYYDAENDEVISFITNNMELRSLAIANIYRNR